MIDLNMWKECVKGPGKFEGEGPETAYFYDCWLNGEGEDHGRVTVFVTTEEESATFGLTEMYFGIEEDDRGFIYGSELTSLQVALLDDEQDVDRDVWEEN